jgi:hypothetical protein
MKLRLTHNIALVSLLILVSQFQLKAQNDNESLFFDDGGISEASNMVKVGIFSLAVGDLPIYYEGQLTDFISIELGAGLQLNYYISAPYMPIDINPPVSGFSLWMQPKYHFNDQQFYGLLIRHRHYQLTANDVVMNDIAVIWGFTYDLTGHLIIEYSYGIGLRFLKDHDNLAANTFDYNGHKVVPSMPISFKVGYRF